MTEPENQPSSTDNEATERTREVDPNRLVEKDFCLGYEKSSGFEAVTNFKISVGGFVPDSEESVQCPIGYILNAHMENFDDNQEEANLKSFFVTNKTLGSQQGIINAFNCNALWIAQTKEPFLPQYIYKLCRMYMKQPPAERRQYAPVKIIGKQPNSYVWVFNADVHMDGSGNVIPLQQRKFMLEGKKNDHVVNVPTDLDSGEFKALKNLFKAEKALFGNNFPQVLMAHAASSLCANFDLTIDLFDGCVIPVLIGHPVSGKSTALKAVLSVFGNYQLVNSES